MNSGSGDRADAYFSQAKMRLLEPQDIRILEAVQDDGRLNHVELSSVAHLSPSQCHRRLKRLEEIGVVQRYTAILDRHMLGLDVMAFVSVSLSKHGEDPARAFLETIQRFPEILECWSVSGDSDYMMRVVTTDLRAFSDFLMRGLLGLPVVATLRSTLLLKEEKSNAGLPLGPAR